MRISFVGCGFLGIYHFAVIQCFRDHAPEFLSNMDGYYGASIGSVAAVVAACGHGLGIEASNRLAKRAKTESDKCVLGPISRHFDPSRYLTDTLEEILPIDAHRKLSGKIGVSLTEIPSGRNILMRDFNTRSELIKSLVASCYIPIFSGYCPPTVRGKRVMDGGFSDNLPFATHNDVVTVSPWPGDFDVCPLELQDHDLQHYLTISNMTLQVNLPCLLEFRKSLLPPNLDLLTSLQQQGYGDAVRYLKKKGLLSETSDPQISSHLLLGASCSDNQEDSLTDVGDGSSNEYFSLNRMEFEGISMLRRESQTSDYYSLKDGTPGQCFSASLYEGDSVHGDNTDNDTISNSMASVINSSFDEYLE